MKNNVGVLLPVASLPGNHGIGDFGKSSFRFLNWLKDSNYKYWQVLPLNPVGPGNSPYMSTCSEALETRYICLDELVKEKLLRNVPKHNPLANKIDYQDVKDFKEKYLYKAYKAFLKTSMRGYRKFKKENKWLKPFALFTAIRKATNNSSWNIWPDELKYFNNKKRIPNEYADECEFQMFMQFEAFKQWNKIRKYAKELGIIIIADCPFYVGIDSVDCWINKDQFLMDEHYNPTVVSGVPPDVFSEDGQLWGTPIYDFNKMKEDGYSFLINRLASYMKICDLLRLDHFRAFDTYCVIPSEDENARRGKWVEGPKYDFFDTLYHKYPDIKLIAEDLGELFPSVLELRDHYHLPGMFIIQFTIFDPNAMSTDNQIVYPGTHDNQTLQGWLNSLQPHEIEFLKNKFGYDVDLFSSIFEYTWNLPSKMTIFLLQDLLRLGDEARINAPGTIGDPNWTFKFKDFSWMDEIKFFNR